MQKNILIMKLKHYLFIALCALTTACNKQNTFQITGNIDNAANQTIYLEQMALTKNVLIDSTIVSAEGDFKLKVSSPAYPDIYRLRLGNKQFLIPVDSCEVISITADADFFDCPKTIKGSEKALQLQHLRNSVAQLQRQYKRAGENADSLKLVLDKVNQHKEEAKQIILQNPRSIVAYYALYQKMDGLFLFTPYDAEDRKFFSAVATAFHTYMPNYERSQNIYNTVLEAVNAERMQRNQETLQQMINEASVGFLDIELKDINGNTHKLSSLQGNVFLLDFSLATAEENVAYTFELRELYNKYQNQGFQIYQVSPDPNQLLWEESVQALPWISVRGNEEQNADALRKYNVTHLPTTFLFDKTGEIVGKNIPFEQMDSKIKQLLAQ